MGSYGFSHRFFKYNFKINEATGFIFSGLLFHMSIFITEDIELVPNTPFHGNFLNFPLFDAKHFIWIR